MKMTAKSGLPQERLVVFLIVAAGVLLRAIPHPWNVSPILGLALFSGAHLKTHKSLFILLGILFLSDIVLGFHSTMLFTWGSTLLVFVLGKSLKRTEFGAKIFLTSFLGSFLFYLVTNLGVFLVTPLYGKSWEGLFQCYLMGVPFFRNAVVGDTVYTLVFFGTHHLVSQRSALRITSSA